MDRNAHSHTLLPAMLGGLLVLASFASSAQDVSEARADSRERAYQRGTRAASAPLEGAREERATPRLREDRSEASRPLPSVTLPAPPRVIAPPQRAEPGRRDWRSPQDSDADRHENWGELARRQQQRSRGDSQPGQPEQRELQRQPWEQQRQAQRPNIVEARQPTRSRSLQGHVIEQARAEEARRNAQESRPDWRRPRPEDRDDRHEENRPDRMGDRQQAQWIERQRQQRDHWQRDESRRHAEYDRHRHDLEQARRHAQYRYQQDFRRRWLAAQMHWNSHHHDDYRDPRFHAPYNYHYSHGGHWYSTSRYGAELLRQAVRDGYREGWLAGQADRIDRWRFDDRGNYGWIDGSYGYSGYYVSFSDYRYYFRQGFERGYRDGYYDRYQYGSYRNGSAMILPAVLGLILAFSIH